MNDNATIILDIANDLKPPNNSAAYLQTVADILPFSVTLDNGPWICGGVPRRLIAKHELNSDIDIYFKSNYLRDQAYKVLIDRFGSNASTKRSDFQFDNGVTNTTVNVINTDTISYEIQLMSCEQGYTSLSSVLNSFDYTICMAATDLTKVLTYMRPYYDITHKVLRINNVNDLKLSVPRLYKYMAQGFAPIPKTLEILFASVQEERSLVMKSKIEDADEGFTKFVKAFNAKLKPNKSDTVTMNTPSYTEAMLRTHVNSMEDYYRRHNAQAAQMVEQYNTAIDQQYQNIRIGAGPGGAGGGAGVSNMVWLNEIGDIGSMPPSPGPARPSRVSVSAQPYTAANVIQQPINVTISGVDVFNDIPF